MTTHDNRVQPWDLRWHDVDPRQHPFDQTTAARLVAEAAPPDERRLFPQMWVHVVTDNLIARLGRWAVGWRWARDEGDFGGGPIATWCCTTHSFGNTPAATQSRVTDALCEWRTWLEELADTFDRYPLNDPHALHDQRDTWQHAAMDLINRVVDRTGAGDAWYNHCAQVLTWYLTRWDMPEDTAADLVDNALSGRFASWIEPADSVIQNAAERLAAALPAAPPPPQP